MPGRSSRALAGTGTPGPVVTRQATAVQPLTTVARAADIDTTVTVRFNDYACINIPEPLNEEYLYPDEKYKLYAASPGAGTVNVNVLIVDENDQLTFRQVRPELDVVKKTWNYGGLVPVVQFNDIVSPQEKTFTIKTQKYYICVDDRKESGASDNIYKVPIRLTRH